LDLTLAALPLDAWVLLAVAVGLGLGVEVAFYRARRRDRARGGAKGDDDRHPRNEP